MKKDCNCNAPLPFLCKYGTVLYCHHSHVQFKFYFVARKTYFESLTDDTITSVVCFVSKYPLHPQLHRFIESSNLFKLVRTGGLLKCTVANLMEEIISKPLLCLGSRFMDKDTIIRLYFPRNQDFEVVLPHVERVRIRWLELTKNLVSTMKDNYRQFLQRQ